MSKEVKVVLIGAAGVILAAIISGIFLLRSTTGNGPISPGSHSVTPSPTPTPMLVITPTSIGIPGDGTNCSSYLSPVTCTVTLSESSSSQSSLNWNTSNGGTDATFSPSSGILSPGQTIQVTITTSYCGRSLALYFEASWNTVTVTYSCG
jgi:FlaG/FlaF family flagellin (archaellin)